MVKREKEMTREAKSNFLISTLFYLVVAAIIYIIAKFLFVYLLPFIIGTIITVISIVIGIFLSKLFAKDNYLQKIYTYSFAVANFSFMGNAVVLGIFGEDVLFDYMIFTLPLCLYVYSFGTASLIPKRENEKSAGGYHSAVWRRIKDKWRIELHQT